MEKLALHGGTPLTSTGLKVLDWPPVSESTADKLRELYLGKAWSFNSPTECEFEKLFASYHGAKHGIFMVNGTVTLECALEVLGVGPGDEVILPALTWIATAMAVRYVGAIPVFVDVEPSTMCLDPIKFEEAITSKTRAVIPVHLYGGMADNEKIIAIAKKHNLSVVEDCAHMQGGFWNGRGTGSWGDIGSFSFQQSKTLSSGEGGICITNDDELAEHLYRCKHIGYSRYEKQGEAARHPPVGLTCHNYRGTAFQARILIDQLEGLPNIIKTYNQFYERLDSQIFDIPGLRLQSRGRLASPQGFYGLLFLFDGDEWKDIPSAKINEAIAAEGVNPPFGTYGSVYKHPLFNLKSGEYRISGESCPVSDEIASKYGKVYLHFTMYYPETADMLSKVFHKLYLNIDELRKDL